MMGPEGVSQLFAPWRAPEFAIPAPGLGREGASVTDSAGRRVWGIRYQGYGCQGGGQLAYTERKDKVRNEGTRNGGTGDRDSMPGTSLQRGERRRDPGLEENDVLHLAIVCDAKATMRVRYWASRVPRADPEGSGGGYEAAAHLLRTRVRGAVREYREEVESARGEDTASGGPRVLRGSRPDRSTDWTTMN